MQKYRNSEIKSFEFSDLKGTHVVSQGELESFEFKTLDGEVVQSETVTEESIREERKFAKEKNFKIDNVVSDSRGLSRQEHDDLEEKIEAEVKRRLEVAYEGAYAEGLEKGRQEGLSLAQSEFTGSFDQKVEDFGQIIEQVQNQTSKILEKNHSDVYEFIKRFTKWIILKEVNEQVYLEGLLEKLILELNARNNLIVKIGKDNFSQMPEVIKTVESRLGHLSNIRVEIVREINHPGIILESENGLIDGSLEGVFKNIDKIFEQVTPNE